MRPTVLVEQFLVALTLELHLQLRPLALYNQQIHKNPISCKVFLFKILCCETYFLRATIFPGFFRSRALYTVPYAPAKIKLIQKKIIINIISIY